MTAEKLQANAITDTGMPSVTRNIRQLLDAAETLWTKVGVPGAEAKGNVFLCSRGVDAPQVRRATACREWTLGGGGGWSKRDAGTRGANSVVPSLQKF